VVAHLTSARPRSPITLERGLLICGNRRVTCREALKIGRGIKRGAGFARELQARLRFSNRQFASGHLTFLTHFFQGAEPKLMTVMCTNQASYHEFRPIRAPKAASR
jgi:hypothetical protein